MNNIAKISLVAALYIIVLYVWSLPINDMPFGDVDASTHFALSDAMSSRDRAIYELPYNLNFTYDFANQGKIWYPPQFHLDGSFAQIFGSQRIIPFFIFILIASTAIVLTIFLLMNELYGFWPAFLSSFLIGFSGRDYLTYIFAQWPQAIAYAYIPLILYCFYKYIEKKEKRYIYVTSILLSIQFFFHVQGFIHTAVALAVYFVVLCIKDRKIPVNINHGLIALLILLILIVPYAFLVKGILAQGIEGNASSPLLEIFSKPGESFGKLVTRTFGWYPSPDLQSYPEQYYSFNQMIGFWIIPFFILGLIVIFLKKDNKNLLLFAWLISFYLIIHLDLIGKGGRIPRSLQAEAYIFYPIAAIGLLAIPSLIKLESKYRNYLKIGLISLFIILAFSFNVSPAYNGLKNAYPSISRVTPEQYKATEWLKGNIEDNGIVADIGTLSLSKVKWMRQLAQKPVIYQENLDGRIPKYILFDASDITKVGSREQISQFLGSETQLQNLTKIYDKDQIRVYKIG